MDTLTKEELERIVKCVVAYNSKTSNPVQFDQNFLKLYDNADLVVSREGDVINLKLRME